MGTHERVWPTIFDVENYPLAFSRGREVERVLSSLETSPVVFVWAPAGTGKTGFGRELVAVAPTTTRLILGTTLNDATYEARAPYDRELGGVLTVVDEFRLESAEIFQRIKHHIQVCKRFVFLLHHPRRDYMEWRSRHKRELPYMVALIEEFPDAPWMYLRKWRRITGPRSTR